MTAAERALADIETYVAACGVLGRARITLGQVRELSSAEDGIALSALDADASALTAAADVAEAAVSAERTAIDDLMRAWHGGSGSAATDFLERQCEAAAGLLAALASAGEVIAALRDKLVRLMDIGADASMRVAGRPGAEGQVWLAQAWSVLQGTADGAAVDLVGTRIAAYVDTDISGEWATAMTSTTDSVAGAYRDALARLDGIEAARFEVAAPAPTAGRTIRRANGSAAAPAPAVASAAAPTPAAAPVQTGTPSFPLPLPMPPAPSSIPLGGDPGEPVGLETPGRDPAGTPVKPAKKAKTVAPQKVATASPEPTATTTGAQPAASDPVEQPAAAAPLPAPQAAPEPESPQAPQSAQPLPAEAGFQLRTPCEIAADELPQVGQ